jgi:indole-3-glycerol phosphate synthase
VSALVPDLLAAIVAAAARRVAVQATSRPISQVEHDARLCTAAPQSFRSAVGRRDCLNVIAECKRRSPSKGVLRWNYDAVDVAGGYASAGAAAISVLTEPTFFDGSLEHLASVRRAVTVPLLRKDFIIDPYQIAEARAAGADAVLLIVAALDDARLRDLLAYGADLAVDALVEVHDERELERAVHAGAAMIGVNNRNLRTLEVDVDASHRLARAIPRNVLRVAESGLRTAADIRALREAGYDAFLIGERFMTTENPGRSLEALLADASELIDQRPNASGTSRRL